MPATEIIELDAINCAGVRRSALMRAGEDARLLTSVDVAPRTNVTKDAATLSGELELDMPVATRDVSAT